MLQQYDAKPWWQSFRYPVKAPDSASGFLRVSHELTLILALNEPLPKQELIVTSALHFSHTLLPPQCKTVSTVLCVYLQQKYIMQHVLTEIPQGWYINMVKITHALFAHTCINA